MYNTWNESSSDKTNTKLLDPEFAYYYFQTDTIKKSLYNLRKDAIGQSSIAIM